MARNEEKAQSMLFRFRESQMNELGLMTRANRRPKAAIGCKDLRQAEKWRGEILREISRKVSKIQDSGLTDYEVRDVNDEINDLLRQKANWENQIISLGGANYKRGAQKTVDGDGREVPGMRGYKYFGRAKELPGVKELFQSYAEESAELETYKEERLNLFSNPPEGYLGDQDNDDQELIQAEEKAEALGWKFAVESLRETVTVEITPDLPTTNTVKLTVRDNDVAMTEASEEPETGKKSKAKGKKQSKTKETPQNEAILTTILKQSDLEPPTLPTQEETEAYIVGRQKEALMAEYDL